MTNNNTFQNLIADTFTSINDQVYCNLIDVGIEADNAYRVAMIEVPFGPYDMVDAIESNLSEDADVEDAFLL